MSAILPELKFRVYRPSKAEKEVVDNVYTRKLKMESERQSEENRWDDWDYLYVSAAEDVDDYRATINPPLTFSVIETAKTELINQRVRFQLNAKNLDFEENSQILEDIINKHIWHKADGDLEYMKMIHDTLLYGTAMMKVHYKKEMRTVQDIVDYKVGRDGKEEKKYKKRLVIDFDDVTFEHINIRDFYVDEAATSLQDARDCLERKIYDIHEFRRMYQTWPKADQVQPGGDTFDPALPREESLDQGLAPTEGGGGGGQADKREHADSLVEVIEYWNKPMDRHIVVANGVLIFDEPMPYDHKELPYVRNVDVMIPDEFYGIGEAEILQHFHNEMKLLRRMSLDNKHLSMHAMFVTDQNFDDAELFPEPGKVLQIERGGTLHPLQMPQVGDNVVQQLEMLRKDAEDATGINRQLIGAQAQGDTTLGEVQLLKESALKRIRLKVKVIEALAMKRLGSLLVSTVQQIYRRPQYQVDGITGKQLEVPRVVRIEGKGGRIDFPEITPDDVRGDQEVEIIPGSSLPLSRGLQLRSVLDMFPQMEPYTRDVTDEQGNVIQEAIFNIEELWRFIFDAGDLPKTAFTKQRAVDDVGAEDILGAVNQGKMTDQELRQNLQGQRQVQGIADEEGAALQPVEGEQVPIVPEQAQRGVLQTEQPAPSADEVAAPDIAAAEDHTDRILAGEEVFIQEGFITPRHILIHERDLDDPNGPFVDAPVEMRNALEDHIEQEKELLRDSAEQIEL